jgi:putative FmdB family regulatory protein
MPVFVYKCEADHQFEELQTIHEAPLSACREPGCPLPVHKVIGKVSFSFKGGSPTKKFYPRG